MRLDLRVPPTAPEKQSRLGAALSADRAGWPNGRRPNDDVTDIAVRVVGGTNYIANHVGDGVTFAQAHKPSDSYLALSVQGDNMTGQWDVALRDLDFAIGLDADGDGEITWGEVKASHRAIAAGLSAP